MLNSLVSHLAKASEYKSTVFIRQSKMFYPFNSLK